MSVWRITGFLNSFSFICCFADNGKEMYQHVKRTCRVLFWLINSIVLWRSRCRRRRRCLSPPHTWRKELSKIPCEAGSSAVPHVCGEFSVRNSPREAKNIKQVWYFPHGLARRISHRKFTAHVRKRLSYLPCEEFCSALSRVRRALSSLVIYMHGGSLQLLLYIEVAISFLIGQKRTVNFGNQRLWRHTCRLYNNHVTFNIFILLTSNLHFIFAFCYFYCSYVNN